MRESTVAGGDLVERKGIAISRRESHLYLRSPMVWVAALVVGAVTMSLIQSRSPVPLDLLLTRGEYLVVPVTLLVAALVFSSGLAREEREGFHDIWDTLPVRSTTQYWGKLLGALPVSAVFVTFLLLLIPVVWIFDGVVNTESVHKATSMYIAQGFTVVLLALGLSAFVHSVVPSFRTRGVVAVGLVVLIALSPRFFGIPWGVLLAPHVVGGAPLGFSAVFGLSPWEPAVTWHLVFHIAVSISLFVASSLVYKRRREARNWLGVQHWPWIQAMLLTLSLCVAVTSAYKYRVFWQEIFSSIQMEASSQAATLRVGVDYPVPQVSAYDITAHWTGESEVRIVTRMHFKPDSARLPTPFTLHRQWEITRVEGDGLLDWERDGNLLWITTKEGLESVSLTVDYHGKPFVWDFAAFTSVPAHFLAPTGGYLSPHMAWYPLPGTRALRRFGPTRSDEVRIGGEPLLDEPAYFRLAWHGPDGWRAAASLPWSEDMLDSVADEARTFEGLAFRKSIFEGHADGVALFTGRLEQTTFGSYSILGAPSVTRDADHLATLYGDMLDFYRELLDRPLNNASIVVVPNWLANPYGLHRNHRTRMGTELRWALVLPLLGKQIALTEHHAAFVLDRAATWQQTSDPHFLLEASEYLHDALQQSLWTGVHGHLPFTRSPVVAGVADFARLQWVRHVLGEQAYLQSLEHFLAQDPPRASNLRITDEVLKLLIQLDETMGATAVKQVLGWVYDRVHEGELQHDEFVAYVQRIHQTESR